MQHVHSTCPNGFAARDLQMLTAIQELHGKMDGIAVTQRAILRHLQVQTTAGVEELPDSVTLPVNTMQDVDELERQLDDPAVKRLLVSPTVLLISCVGPAC